MDTSKGAMLAYILNTKKRVFQGTIQTHSMQFMLFSVKKAFLHSFLTKIFSKFDQILALLIHIVNQPSRNYSFEKEKILVVIVWKFN